MQSGIGSTLREARKRRKVELSEVEAATKIRRAYLRAIEAEDWEALPGDTYARGFVRTYASYLGLDGARLAEGVPARQQQPLVIAPRRGVSGKRVGDRRPVFRWTAQGGFELLGHFREIVIGLRRGDRLGRRWCADARRRFDAGRRRDRLGRIEARR